MRIVVVTAHYPPNFVSGGTLQPQRLARALRARGHDAFVYAGWLGDREPLSSWSETDEVGLPVRWVTITPWIDWASTENFDNVAVVRHFSAFLDEVKPDVVHLHSLQAMGGGLVAAAAASGAAAVVTMHDFWWVCGRQFLVNRDMHPCCPVVDTGACECHIDHGWLEGRNRWLREQLTRADLILTPSEPASRVLAANGIDASRLFVDENGMPEGGAAAFAEPRGGGGRRSAVVRFLYAGGSEEMKGVHVLIDACRRLAHVAGWEVHAYGAERWIHEHGIRIDDLPVIIRPAFSPEAAAEVFAAADMLVLPSVMRESYSLLTREALARGLPVICTDTLGPEEVVEEDRNGFVVAADDAESLADAMRRIVDEPELLDRLRRGIGSVRIRSLDDQVAGLEHHYEALALGRKNHPASRTVRHHEFRQVLFLVGIDGAPLRYRARLPAEALGLLGIQSDVRYFMDPEVPRLIDRADAVVVYRVPATDWILTALDRARSQSKPLLFDVDDLIFDPSIAEYIPALKILPPDEAERWMHGVHRYRTTMEHCDLFIASTPLLARHAEAIVGLPAERFDNGVGLLLGQASDRALAVPRQEGPLRIGYFSGTDTHDHDWAMIEPVVAAVLGHRPDVELWLGGHLPPTPALDRFGDRVRRLPFQHWLRLPSFLRDVDVNLSPLVPGTFNEAKSAIKWLEAALVATPTVASPTEPFRAAIEPGVSGLLADSPDEWRDALVSLLDESALRVRIGQRARREALLRWSPHVQAARYLKILQRAAEAHTDEPISARSSWTPVVVEEQPLARELDSYQDESGSRLSRRVAAAVRERIRRLVARLRVAIEKHGWWGTAGRLPSAVVRRLMRR